MLRQKSWRLIALNRIRKQRLQEVMMGRQGRSWRRRLCEPMHLSLVAAVGDVSTSTYRVSSSSVALVANNVVYYLVTLRAANT